MKKHTTILKALILIILVHINIKTQAQNYDPNKIIPPTPTAGALGAYGNYTVGYYNGTPNINIPLYNIKTNGNNLDLHLQYDASGIKVLQDASWVGLGWSLMAGGVITRTIRGYGDFKDATAYYRGPALPPYTPTASPNTASKPAYDEIYYGRVDSEPDLFNYNFGAFSGKFVLGKQADGSKVFVDDRNDLKIEYNGNWKVTDSKGYKYYFNIVESASNYSRTSSTAQVNPTHDLRPFAFESLETTAWYLDSIAAPNKDVIKFNYVRGSSLSLINMSEIEYDRSSPFAGCSTGGDFQLYYRTYNASRSLNNDLYLKSIVYANGSVEFNTSDRTDIDYDDVNNKPKKLSNIAVYDQAHQLLKTFTFDYSYFNNVGDSQYDRLRLDAVTEADQNGNKKPPYKLSYNNDIFPSKYSNGIDHWGFYNGAANSRLLPMPSALRPGDYSRTDDANREPDTTYNFVKLGILTSITYPTGGYTNFDYELNDYSPGAGYKEDKGVGYLVNSNPFDQTAHNFVSFDIQPNDIGTISGKAPGSVFYQYNYAGASASDTHLFAGLTVDYGGLTGPTGVRFDNSTNRATDPNGNGGSNTQQINLPAGHYTMSVRYVQGYSVACNLYYTIQVPVTYKKGGGLRIKSITNYDAFGGVNTRSFLYTSNHKSTGKLLFWPTYGYVCPGISLPGVCYPSSGYICRLSGSAYPPGLSSKGYVVGYDEVTELVGANGESGRTEHYYYNTPDVLSSNPGAAGVDFPGAPRVTSPYNGKEYQTITYDVTGNKLKKTVNDFAVKDTASIKGIKLYSGPPISVSTLPSQGVITPYNVYFYDNTSTWCVQTGSKETNYYYNNNGQVDSLSTDRSFFYDNPVHLQLTRQSETRSDGKTLTSLSTYPDDYAVGTAFLDDMKMVHQTGVPVEQVSYLSDVSSVTIVGGSITEYKTGGKGQIDKLYKFDSITPAPLSSFKFSNAIAGHLPVSGQYPAYVHDPAYQLKVTFNQYDGLNNPLMITPADGVPISYVWSYNKQYPIAKLLNADYTTVSGILNGTQAIDNFANSNPTDAGISTFLTPLRNSALLKNAQITTFTYKTQLGMTSSTDAKGETTTYEYDGFQRLMNIKDKDGNIVKHMDYHYQGQ